MGKSWKANLSEEQLQVRREHARLWNQNNKERHKITARKWSAKHRDHVNQKSREFSERYPWYMSWQAARQRCTNPKHASWKYYGAKGIKFQLTKTDMAFLWARDNPAQFIRPTLDRINNNGNYCRRNCQWLELGENTAKMHKNIRTLLKQHEQDIAKSIKSPPNASSNQIELS